ncbi:hypothetical protein [Allosphingosinicella vermicomposti]|uniref:hypothetical protein n=1 Tax=Allosphingosinicella vermicomposti TaxID=614671 RepID=UPI00131A4AE6|nr:hypothetical protein [Allosphingosinicella vermicomposti]
MIVIPLALVASAAAFGYSTVAEKTPPPPEPRKTPARKVLSDACGSRITYDRLKAQLFEEALDLREGDPAALDLLAGTTVVRVEDPVVQAYDESLGVIVCGGEFILELPPGAEDAFDGRHRINARIEYAAQKAADGSGPVYRMRGAEPIIYRLAAFGLPAEAGKIAAIRAAIPLETTEIAPPEAAAVPPIVKIAAQETVEAALPPAPKVAEPPKKPEVAPKKALPAKKAELVKVSKAEKPGPKKAAAKTVAKPLKTAALKTVVPEKKKPAPVTTKAVKAPPKKKKAAEKPVRIAAKPVPKKVVASRPKKSAALLKPAAGQRKAAANTCRASRRSAQILCANPALAAKERRTTSLYYSALENADRETASILRRTAGTFSTYLAACDNEACVSQAFDGRTREIRDILSDMR